MAITRRASGGSCSVVLDWLAAFYKEPAACPGGRHCTCPPEAEELPDA